MIDLVLSALAAFRLSRLLADDAGPFRIIERFRLWLYRPKRNPVVDEISEIIACPYCSGLWFSALFILPTLMQSNDIMPNPVTRRPLRLLIILRAILAVAGLQEIIESHSRRDG